MTSKRASAVEVVCVGEAMGQFVPADGRRIEDAGTFALHQAGAESNVAIGLARLGHRAVWVSRLGDDAIGRRIRTALEREGVEASLPQVMDDRPTGVFLKDPDHRSRSVTYYRRGSAASRLDRSDIGRALGLRPRLLHLSGVVPALSASCDDAVGFAIEAARARAVMTSFDVNYRPALWRNRDTAAERLLEIANASDIVFVGLDEAGSLWGSTDAADVRRAIPSARTLVVKEGARRATSFGADVATSVPALRVDVVESVGAGDAFAAGWLSGFLRGHEPSVALRCGHLMARAALMSLSDQGEVLPVASMAVLARDESLWSTAGRAEGR